MPNHCANFLQIGGTQTDILQFKDLVGDLNLANLIPHINPADYTKACDQNSDLVERKFPNAWCGTKWGAYDTTSKIIPPDISPSDLELDLCSDIIGLIYQYVAPTHLEYRFTTAWSPWDTNCSIIISKIFPRLDFQLYFAERGTDFYGCHTFRNGSVKEDTFSLGNQLMCSEKSIDELDEDEFAQVFPQYSHLLSMEEVPLGACYGEYTETHSLSINYGGECLTYHCFTSTKYSDTFFIDTGLPTVYHPLLLNMNHGHRLRSIITNIVVSESVTSSPD